MDNIYCVRCKKVTGTDNVQNKTTKNGRNMIQGKCQVCGSTKCKFVAGGRTGGMLRPMVMRDQDYVDFGNRVASVAKRALM